MVKHKNSFVASLLKNNDVEVNNESNETVIDDTVSEDSPVVRSKHKGASSNSSNLIQECVVKFQLLDYSKSDKANISINPMISQKLKLVAIASKVSLFDLSNAILFQYLEENKKEIAVILKKLSV